MSGNTSSTEGGAIHVGGNVTFTNSTISGNTSTGKGGAIFSVGSTEVTNSTISGNSTSGDNGHGGAIYSNSGAVTLTNSTVSGNSTAGVNAYGGGILTSTGAVTLTGSIVSGNQVTGASSDGGGVWFDDSVVTIVNSTVTGNSASRAGGGLGMSVDLSDNELTIHNSIIAGNTAGSNPDFTAPDTPATNLEVRHSLIGRSDGTSLTASASGDSNGNLIGGTIDPTKIDPKLGPLAFNGGPTLTHALLSTSPAINRGSNTLAAGLTTDQRGNPFARILQTTVDMGAFERATLLGTANADAFVLTYSSLTTSGTVTFTISTNGGSATSLGTFPTNSALTIDGLGGPDSVRVVGTSGADTIAVNSVTGLVVNGASLILQGIENRTLAGAAGVDVYKFDADAALGTWTLDEAGGGTDTIDFSSTTTVGVSLNLATPKTQVVHATNLSLILGSVAAFENAVGGSGADSLAGNGLSNILSGGPGNDKLNGNAGSDILSGGLNDDSYYFGTAAVAEADQVNESANQGTDTLRFATITTDVVLNLSIIIQNVHTNRTVKLNFNNTFENIVGGTANDTLIGNTLSNRFTGGNGNNILVGLDGSDFLQAGSGRDILIGGLGLDTLNGGAGDDILIAGRTTSDSSLANLNTLRTQWISANSYAARVAALRAGVGSPVVSLKAKTNVLNDAGEDDSLTGGIGTDRYFRALDDVITDLVAGELIDVL